MGLFLVRVPGFTVWIYTAACEEIRSQHHVQGILQGLSVCSSCALSPTACNQPTKAWVSTSNISVVHVHHEVRLLYRGFCTGTTSPPKGLQVLLLPLQLELLMGSYSCHKGTNKRPG